MRALLASELLKLRTTRVPSILLAITAAFSAVVAAALVASGALQDDRALALAQGANVWTTLATVVGILVVTNEYRHGTITTTFLAEPRRVRVLASKLATSLVAGAVFGLGAAVATAAVALPWLAARGEALALDAQALEAVGRLTLAYALAAALGAAVGAILQSQVGTIAAVFVWLLVVESVVGILSSLVWGEFGERDPVSPYLPGTALQGIVGGEAREFAFAGPQSALLTVGYVAALSVLGAAAMARRDP